MREFKSFSASQIATFRDCHRSWWFQSIMGLPTPQRASAALGEAVHAQLETYLEDGTLPDESTDAGRIAKSAIPHAPKPGEVWVEVSMSDRKKGSSNPSDTSDVPLPGNMPRLHVAGLPVNGFIDVLDLSGDKPVVIDWKTTSDMKYAKTAEDLRHDAQMILYGSYALEVCASMGVAADEVDTGHVVLLTRGAPQARKTMVTLNAAHLAAERAKIAETVEEMKVHARATSPDDVPGEASSCNKYGGCHFKDKCQALSMFAASPVASLFSHPSTRTSTPQEESMSTTQNGVDPMAAIAALRARKAAEAAAAAAGTAPAPAPVAAAPVPVAAPVAAPTPAPAASTESSSALAATLAKYGVRPATHAAPAPSLSIVPDDTPSQVRPAFAQPTPAQAAPVAAPAAEAAEEGKAVRKPRDHQAKLAALNWTVDQIGKMHAEAMRTAIDNSLDGREHSVLPNGTIFKPGVGAVRPTPEQDEALFHKVFPEETKAAEPVVETSTPAQVASLAAAPAPVAAPVAAPAPVAPAAVAAPNLVLYIDCAPEKGRERDYVLLEDYIQPMLSVVTEAYNKTARDNERVDFYALIPYARGPAFLAALVLKNPPKGILVANTRFPATNAILEVLIPMADVVVRGLR
jgi:RecB family exonuclease